MLAQLSQLSNPWWMFVILGIASGVLSGALGVGSGIVFIPILASVFLLPQKSAQGTTLAVMVPMALLGAIRYWHNPSIEINMTMVALIVTGALGGVLIGTTIMEHIPGHYLRKAFAVFLVIVAVRMFVMPKRKPAPTNLTDNNPTEVLKTKGYKTACIGKWHAGEEPNQMPLKQGFDYFYGTPKYNGWTKLIEQADFRCTVLRNEDTVKVISTVEEMGQLTKMHTREAAKFIKQNKDNAFFLYLAHNMPHVPLGASPKFRGKSEGGFYGDVIEENHGESEY